MLSPEGLRIQVGATSPKVELSPGMLHAARHYQFVMDRADDLENPELSPEDHRRIGSYIAARADLLRDLLVGHAKLIQLDFVLDSTDTSKTTYIFSRNQVVTTTHEKGKFGIPRNRRTVRLEAHEWAQIPNHARQVANGLIENLPIDYRNVMREQVKPKTSLPAEPTGGIL